MKLERVMRRVYCEPWLILPSMHATIRAIVEAHASGTADHEKINAEFGGKPDQPEDMMDLCEGVAVIPINGVIGKGLGGLEKMSGMCDTDDLQTMLDWAAEDDAVKAVLLAVNSPGGTIAGVPEAAAAVAKLNASKPVFAHTDELMASAAYWIGSQARAIYATPSAVVGSIGVYMPMYDQSRQVKNAGVDPEVIKSGKYKGAGLVGIPLSEAQREHMQEQVDYIHAQFKDAVRAGRGDIEDGAMQGQEFFAEQAREVGLVDELMSRKQAIEQARKYAS